MISYDPTMPKRGAPVLDPETEARIVEALRAGRTSYEVAAETGIKITAVWRVRRQHRLGPEARLRAAADATVRRLTPAQCVAYQRELLFRDRPPFDRSKWVDRPVISRRKG